MMTQDAPSNNQRSPVRGAVDPEKLKGKIPDSKRVFPYDATSHAGSKYALEPDTRPEEYDPGVEPVFDMAGRKLQTLLLGLLLGSVILGVSLTCGLLFGKADRYTDSGDISGNQSINASVFS